MRKSFAGFAFGLLGILFSVSTLAQSNTIKGNVTNGGTGQPVPAVSVLVKGEVAGTFTDDKGSFTLTVQKAFPLTLIASSIGFESKEITVTNANQEVGIVLTPSSVLGQEIVVSATRTASNILESPVTIERISAANIRNSTAASYYDMVGKLNGVDVVNASLTFASPSTRGFNGSGNLRLNQIVDGMDNQAPGLNFSVGSVVGLTELDVESMELLPGASSALYGPGGMNGALIITGKDPFEYQGLSFQVKTGVMNIDNQSRKASPYYNWNLRWAKKVSDKFAFKIAGELIQAKDWVADDYRNYDRLGTTGRIKDGTRETDPNFDGVNIYGDETTADVRSNVLDVLAAAAPFYKPYVDALPASIPVSRTGYKEKDILNPNTVNAKVSGMLSYKLSPRTALNAAAYIGTGNTVYTGSDRYSLLNLSIGQYKIELVNPKWFLRGYTTQEDAGESFNATVTTRLTNEAWKPSGGAGGWFYQYGLAFLNGKVGGMTDINAHNSARAIADKGRPDPNSQLFKTLFDKVRSVPISDGGGLFVDKTNLYNVEGQYDFSETTKNVVDILIGGNYKKYVLNSEGTLFADSTGTIPINEYGAYLQATKRLVNNKLKLIASARYDKNDNFDGRFTPRFSAVITVAEDNNIRLSYQQAYRFGSTQQQWINLKVADNVTLIGGVPQFRDFYKINSSAIYSVEQIIAGGGNPTAVTPAKFKAETVSSYEGGYKGLLFQKRLLVDVYGYYGEYKDFITRRQYAQPYNDVSVYTNPATEDARKAALRQPAYGRILSLPANVEEGVTTYGFGLNLTYSLRGNFLVSANGSSDNLEGVPEGFVASFNAPKYRAGVSVANTGFGTGDRLGFNIVYRWQDDVQFQSDFASGLLPAFHTLDGQISYKFPAQNVLLKVGGTNLLNQYYRNGFGNATIGGLYYVSIGYNLF